MKKYPFQEGERYFTIEDHTVVESVWDDISEQLHDNGKLYFKTAVEALLHYRFTRTDEMLTNAVILLGDLKVDDDERNEKIIKFLEAYNYFNSIPKFSFI